MRITTKILIGGGLLAASLHAMVGPMRTVNLVTVPGLCQAQQTHLRWVKDDLQCANFMRWNGTTLEVPGKVVTTDSNVPILGSDPVPPCVIHYNPSKQGFDCIASWGGPAKPYTVAMCSTKQETAPADYIKFCIANSPNNFPACDIVPSPNRAGYFEVLDCSWHAGRNPR